MVLLSQEAGTGGWDNFVERRKQVLREVRLALEKRSKHQEAARV